MAKVPSTKKSSACKINMLSDVFNLYKSIKSVAGLGLLTEWTMGVLWVGWDGGGWRPARRSSGGSGAIL
jgi:hypothetical protein